MSGVELRDALLTEVFIDTHRALFMAYFENDAKPDNRAFVHGAYVRSLTAAAHLPRHQAYAIVRPMVEREIASCRANNRLAAAQRLAMWMMSLDPDGEMFHDLATQLELEALSR